MKIKYLDNIENKNNDLILYPENKQKTRDYLIDRIFKRVGKSYEDHSSKGWKASRVLYLIGILSGGILFLAVPFLHPNFRKEIKNTIKEIKTGIEKIEYYAPTEATKNKYKQLAKDHLQYNFAELKNILSQKSVQLDNPIKKVEVEFSNFKKATYKIKGLTQVFEWNFDMKSNNDENPLNTSTINNKLDEIKEAIYQKIDENLNVYVQSELIIFFEDTEKTGHVYEVKTTRAVSAVAWKLESYARDRLLG